MPRLLALSLVFLLTAPLFAQNVTIDVSDRVGPDRLALVHVTVENPTDEPMHSVTLEMHTGFHSDIQDVSADDPTAFCGGVDPTFTLIGCTFPTLAPHAKATATVTTQYAPGHYEIVVNIAGRMKASRQITFYREFSVTKPANDGPGSLRQAILDSNEQCPTNTPCRINFEIPGPPPAEGWFTIPLAWPLPA